METWTDIKEWNDRLERPAHVFSCSGLGSGNDLKQKESGLMGSLLLLEVPI